jgi:alpha-galactosidase
MSLWAILAAPLLAGNDLSTMTPETTAILTNKDVIAIDQDAAGKQGDRAWTEGPLEIWTKPLANGDVAVGIFNRAPSTLTTQLDVHKLGFAHGAKAKDLWTAKDLGHIDVPYPVTLTRHSVLLLRLSTK